MQNLKEKKDYTSVMFMYESGVCDDTTRTLNASVETIARTISEQSSGTGYKRAIVITSINGKSYTLTFNCDDVISRDQVCSHINWCRYFWLGWTGSEFLNDEQFKKLHKNTMIELQA